MRPPGGTRHSRIRASSPAMERGVYLHCRAADTWLPCPLRAWSLLSALGTQAPYPQRDDVGQRGPRPDPLQLYHSAVWAMPCQAGGLAAAAGGGSPPHGTSEPGKGASSRKTGAWPRLPQQNHRHPHCWLAQALCLRQLVPSPKCPLRGPRSEGVAAWKGGGAQAGGSGAWV